jgi:hypothetical protein
MSDNGMLPVVICWSAARLSTVEFAGRITQR